MAYKEVQFKSPGEIEAFTQALGKTNARMVKGKSDKAKKTGGKAGGKTSKK